MASYVIVDVKAGEWVTFYPWGEVTTKSHAVEIVKDLNEEAGCQAYKIMPEMEYYRTYEPSIYAWLMRERDKEAEKKAKRERIKAARKAWKEKQEAKKAKWLPGGILNFH